MKLLESSKNKWIYWNKDWQKQLEKMNNTKETSIYYNKI